MQRTKNAAFYLTLFLALMGAGIAGQERQIQAQLQDISREAVDTTNADRIAELEAVVEELEEQSARKSNRIDSAQRWNRNLQARVYQRNRTITRLQTVIEDLQHDTIVEQDRLWTAGYLGAGGKHLAEFQNVILPCESGGFPGQEHTIVGDVTIGGSHGRAQIYAPVWKAEFERLFGVDFETHITNPVLNGAMAAHIEQVQGLNAWTCWRIR